MDFLGFKANYYIIKNKLDEILNYRRNMLNQIFGNLNNNFTATFLSQLRHNVHRP